MFVVISHNLFQVNIVHFFDCSPLFSPLYFWFMHYWYIPLMFESFMNNTATLSFIEIDSIWVCAYHDMQWSINGHWKDLWKFRLIHLGWRTIQKFIAFIFCLQVIVHFLIHLLIRFNIVTITFLLLWFVYYFYNFIARSSKMLLCWYGSLILSEIFTNRCLK